MKKYLILLTLLLNIGLLYPHCQVPCGVYDDAIRIVTIKEDFATISKAMVEIKTLSAKNDPQSLNQLNRWIVTKEEHATNIQKVVSDYFLTQRVKSKNKNFISKICVLTIQALMKNFYYKFFLKLPLLTRLANFHLSPP